MHGAVTLAMRPAQRPSIPVNAPKPVSGPASEANRPPRPQRTAGFGASNEVYVVSSDGTLHSLNTANGANFDPPFKFLPPNANASGLVVMDMAAYAATTGGCGGAADGVWAVDMTNKNVANWKANGKVAGSAGPAFGPDGTVYVSTTDGTLAALEPLTLKQLKAYKSPSGGFTSSPVVFGLGGKILAGVATSDGKLELIDTANLQGSAVATSAATMSTGANAPAALTSWQDPSGTRWILAAVQAKPGSFGSSNGTVTNGAVVAWKVTEQGGSISLQPGWTSRDLNSPVAPMVMSGVVFALASGENRDSKLSVADRVKRSSPAVLYALDGATGKELWNSGQTMTSFVHGATLSGGASQVYATTHDGTLYAFGFPIEH